MTRSSLFKISDVPFSSYGAWTSISIPENEQHITFRNHHAKANNLFAIHMLIDGKKVKPNIYANPSSLLLVHDNAQVNICYEGSNSLRFRGVGCSIELNGQGIHAYIDKDNQAVFSCPNAIRRYQIDILKGKLELFGAYSAVEEDLDNMATHQGGVSQEELEERERQIITISMQNEELEFAIDEFWSTWIEPERVSFEDCMNNAEDQFSQFKNSLSDCDVEYKKAHELATYINYSCVVSPVGLIKRPTLFMSKNWMNNVWSWDQCYNAISLASGQPQLALDQMLTLVDHQDEFGAYPDCFNDVNIQYNFSKPPVHGLAFSEILKRLPNQLDNDQILIMLDSLAAQANWWLTYRKKADQNLPYYLHGNDSGWDNSTMFSKGVPLIGPELSAMLIVQMDVLSDSYTNVNKKKEADEWKEKADALYNALIDELWVDDHFVAKLANTGELIECKSLIPWLTMILGSRLDNGIKEKLKSGIEKFITDWGVSTEQIDSPDYIEDGYWRGPIWAPSTFLAITGLDKCGYSDTADLIAKRFCDLCKKSGFAENFNAQTAEPLRDKAYTWTSSIFLILSERLNRKS